ncbi:MAG: hypothetical protein LBV35_08230, partial [Acinetobacter sp.]|nr:hypothetical protein [Acinetobacter sp.]
MTHTITINIADRGTPVFHGGEMTTSVAGHMWYEVSDGTSSNSYGFAPREDNLKPYHGDGDVKFDDSANYQGRSYTRTIEITEDQYNKLVDFGRNSSDHGFSQTYDGLSNSCIDFTWKALNVAGLNPKDIDGALLPTSNIDDVAGIVNFDKDLEDYRNKIGKIFEPFNDFNSNGEQKYHIYDPIILDLDGDGIETVAQNKFQGVLFDHDNDGIKTATGWVKPDDGILVIDKNNDGIINHGGELFGDSVTLENGTKAANGYSALAEYDSNQDGKIDAEDNEFSLIKVWRDLNQDGVSQKTELFSLEEAGVKSLSLAYQNTSTALGNKNILAQTGNYETIDGQTKLMGDVNFHFNSVYSDYQEKIELTDQQKQVANVKGLGSLRDLREAATLSYELAATLNAYSIADTKILQLGLLDRLILNWAKTAPNYTDNVVFRSINWIKTESEGIGLTPGQENQVVLSPPLSDEAQAQLGIINSLMPILASFSGTRSAIFYYKDESEIKKIYDLINNAYATLKSDIYDVLLYQTRLEEYVSEIKIKLLSMDKSNFFDYSNLELKFNKVFAENPEKAITDLSDMLTHQQVFLENWVENGKLLLGNYLSYALENGVINNLLNSYNIVALNDLGLIIGTQESDILKGNVKNNILISGKGDDILNGDSGADTLIGGTGNDYLDGGYQGDTYIFSKGHGQDTVSDYSGGQ